MQTDLRFLPSAALLLAAGHCDISPRPVAAITAVAGVLSTGVTLEELVVTAERREQRLQDVPVAISAFTSERRDLIGINTIQDT